jgi:hypothetical protein
MRKFEIKSFKNFVNSRVPIKIQNAYWLTNGRENICTGRFVALIFEGGDRDDAARPQRGQATSLLQRQHKFSLGILQQSFLFDFILLYVWACTAPFSVTL